MWGWARGTAVALVATSACRGEDGAPDGTDGSTSDGASSSPTVDPVTTETTTSNSATDGSTTATTTTTSTSTTTTTTATTMTTTGASTGETDTSGSTGDVDDGCPETLPDGWLYCQDFEFLGDPFTEFDPYFSDATNFEVDVAAARSGTRSLRIRYTAIGDNWSGEAAIRFGDAENGGPIHAPGDPIDEVWVRLFVRTQDEWPGGGFGEVLAVEALEGPSGARVASVSVDVQPGGDVASAEARTCIAAGPTLECDGVQDWMTDTFLVTASGTTDVATTEAGPQWHCLVVHVALNTLGNADGVATLTVDGNEDVALSDLDLRGDWDQTGLNSVNIATAWPGGATAIVERYVDDLVISTAPLACD